ncbi:MAG: Methyltransferase type 11 [Marmoricola sp.]|nr:Methyltransferase type 11 [Marmoricola sp.]
MSDETLRDKTPTHARSFASVAQEYDRSRPSYPPEVVTWLIGEHRLGGPLKVLELGAGTGLLTELVVAAGHEVLATDPLPEMLEHLSRRLPGVATAVATAESIPVPSRSYDVVLCAQSFHWFDHPVALAEIARVLRPGGVLGLVWNVRDEGIPWGRKLGKIIGKSAAESPGDLAEPVRASPYFGYVDSSDHRFWQSLRKDELYDLVRSRSYVAVMPDAQRDELLSRVGALYDDYGRGPDGMQLPYVTRCFRTLVTEAPPAPVVPVHVEVLAPAPVAPDDGEQTEVIDLSGTVTTPPPTPPPPPAPRPVSPNEDTGTILIDFS